MTAYDPIPRGAGTSITQLVHSIRLPKQWDYEVHYGAAYNLYFGEGKRWITLDWVRVLGQHDSRIAGSPTSRARSTHDNQWIG